MEGKDAQPPLARPVRLGTCAQEKADVGRLPASAPRTSMASTAPTPILHYCSQLPRRSLTLTQRGRRDWTCIGRPLAMVHDRQGTASVESLRRARAGSAWVSSRAAARPLAATALSSSPCRRTHEVPFLQVVSFDKHGEGRREKRPVRQVAGRRGGMDGLTGH